MALAKVCHGSREREREREERETNKPKISATKYSVREERKGKEKNTKKMRLSLYNNICNCKKDE